MSIIIVGGGITGLAAAYELARRHSPFVLLESSTRLGGLIRTEHADGCTIEHGADSMLAQKPAALELCDELGLTPRLISTNHPRTAYVHARGTLHPIPSPSVFGIPTTDEGIASYDLLDPPARETLARLTRSEHGTIGRDESVASFFRRHFGPATVGLVAEPLLGGIHAGDVERLSIRSVAPRLVDAEARDANVLRALRTASAHASSPDGMFRSLPGGMGELVSTIVATLPENSIELGIEPRAIERRGQRWHVVTNDGAIDADAVIVATPAHATARLLERSEPDIAQRCAGIPYVSTVSVAMTWPREAVAHPLAGSGFVVARQHSTLRIAACSWVTSKWTDRAPTGTVLLRAFLGGALDPGIVSLDDDELRTIAVRDLADVLGIEGPPELSRVHRWMRAGAQHEVGHLESMDGIDARLKDTPGLFLAGSGFRSIGVPDCVAAGRQAASSAVMASGR